LQGTDLYRANLENSLLSHVDLRKDANLRQAKLTNANLKNAYFSSISQLERANDWQTALIDFNWQEKIAKPRKLSKIGVVIPSLDSIFESYLEGLWSVPGVEVITMHSDDTVEGEAKTIQNLAKEGVDAIVVRPQDPQRSVPAIRAAFRQGIITITIGDCIDKDSSRKFVFGCYESDSFKMGYESTQALLGYMKRKYPGQMINVGLVDGTKLGRVYTYFRGFKQAMEKSGVQWQEVASTDAIDREDIGKIKQMLQSYPQINVIWSGSDTSTDTAIQAIQELGLGSKIKVFGIMDVTPKKS
jgi:ABC-type sugar transport system substrate-binding protein